MILRLLNWQGIAGIAASLLLLGLLVAERVDAGHWHRQSDRFEKLYGQEQLAFANTTAGYRQAAETARADDRANAERVAAEQTTINERTEHDFQTRIAAARAAAARLQPHATAAADPGARGSAPVPGLPVAAGGPAQAAGQNGLPAGDALTATEQAIQLDALIGWVRGQAAVDPNGARAPSSAVPVHP